MPGPAWDGFELGAPRSTTAINTGTARVHQHPGAEPHRPAGNTTGNVQRPATPTCSKALKEARHRPANIGHFDNENRYRLHPRQLAREVGPQPQVPQAAPQPARTTLTPSNR